RCYRVHPDLHSLPTRRSSDLEILRRAQYFNKNLVVLAGDTHNAWASDLYITDDTGAIQRSSGSVGVEFATASVTSPGFENYVGRSEEHTSELQSRENLVCRLL